uniref:Secreted protein n=1 Tax=Romanomermis culicivorax TaxID=13658 RepID=A0A915I120_ROMCU
MQPCGILGVNCSWRNLRTSFFLTALLSKSRGDFGNECCNENHSRCLYRLRQRTQSNVPIVQITVETTTRKAMTSLNKVHCIKDIRYHERSNISSGLKINRVYANLENM